MRTKLVTRPALPLLAMLGCVATWVLARGTGVLVIEQFAVVAMVPAASPTSITRSTRSGVWGGGLK